MKLGFVSAVFAELDLRAVLQFAAAERLPCVELMCWPPGRAERKYAGVTHIDVTGFTRGRAEEIRALCQETGVEISGLGYYPNPLDPEPAAAKRVVNHLKSVIRAAALLDLKVVNTFVGRDWTKTVDENWPGFLKTWKPLVSFAEDQGVRIGIENCPMRFTRDEWPGGKNLFTSPAIWRRAFSDLPSENFGLNYDPSHFALQMMDPVRPLREFGAKLFHLHAKDVLLDRDKMNEHGIFADPAEWHRPRIPGFGEIDWPRFLAALVESGYRGPVCIEVEDESFGTNLAGRTAALKVARNVLSPYFP